MDKSYRIHTNINKDTMLHVNMRQDFDFLEVLTLKLRQKDAYRIHSSNYGVIVGRVLANDAFGIPNAKVSVFIERDTNDSSDIEALYAYTEVTTKDKEGRRYNLLPDYSDNDCYRVVGTFPNKRLLLDDGIQLEIYDKYWKYTTVTNNAGDYMLFGVPADTVQIHVDMDLSDIGVLSQKPRDFEYKGYNLTEFDSPSQFKESTNLDGLAQIFSQNKSVYVYPFWGDSDNGVACITRSDIQIDYKFEPTCVFMGSIVSDNEGHSIGSSCSPDSQNGRNDQLVGGSGTIEMIRKTTDGLVEEYQIQGNQLIDDNGVWCYQIPMNLDFVGTDEYGNIIPTDNPNKGIPTRTQVRFRISKNETEDEGFSRHTAKYLVPMNPIFSEDSVVPRIDMSGAEVEKMYAFGSSTPEHCFRDLYWNNVYSVKNYIPKVQTASGAGSKYYSALKSANLATNQNPFPYNKLNIELPFPYIAICVLYQIVVALIFVINFIICLINETILRIINTVFAIINQIIDKVKVCIRAFHIGCIFKLEWFVPHVPYVPYLPCALVSAGVEEGNVAYFPGCTCPSGKNAATCPKDMRNEDGSDNCEKSENTKRFMDTIQRNLSVEYKIIKLDLYHDWINGCLYMPLWYWRKAKKKKFLFFTIRGAKNEYCSDKKLYGRLKTYFGCNIKYTNNSLGVTNNGSSMPLGEKKWHKDKTGKVSFRRGVIKPVENKDGLTVYYYTGLQATTENSDPNLEMKDRPSHFKAIRLYATDIILLGNLDANNIYGIPQFFKCLPYSTANIPPIATIDISNFDNGTEDKETGAVDLEDSGTTLTTGMDWNYNGDEDNPQYKKGLFIDLACVEASSRAKSCVNVERISELGVNLDGIYSMPYPNGDDIEYGEIEADGFISKLELDDTENRAMFATLNHIGFIPQTYQDMNGFYDTQVNDTNTNYLIPKFKYIYPVDFDGRLQSSMTSYTNRSTWLFDEADESYITFRLGAEKGTKSTNSEGRIRHFYHSDGTILDMPLYNNSYYFYFGINKGSTAIDKFNEMFFAPCFTNSKDPFTIDLNYRGLSYCPSVYDDENKAYPYIEVICDDISKPYSYKLYNSFNGETISEDGMTADKFVIGGVYDGNNIKTHKSDIYYQTEPSVKVEEQLSNQEYKLEMTDSEGNIMVKRVTLDVPKITIDYDFYPLGTKFYDTANTSMDEICEKVNALNGKFIINNINIDGYEGTITNAIIEGYKAIKDDAGLSVIGHYYSMLLEVKCDRISTTNKIEVRMKVYCVVGDEIEGCLCKNKSPYSAENVPESEFVNNTLTLNVYVPQKYQVVFTQLCNGEETTNQTSILVDIQNGSPFITYINDMPTAFLGNKFYDGNTSNSPMDGNTIGWLAPHQETSYGFIPDTKENIATWSDYVPSIVNDIASPIIKREILKFKFDSMFSLSNGVFMTSNSSKQIGLTSDGGMAPILERSVVPMYDNYENVFTSYICTDVSVVGGDDRYPNVIWKNYTSYGEIGNGPKFNNLFSNEGRNLGNYLAMFTRDGGYINNTTINPSLRIEKSPLQAEVSPLRTGIKQKGEDVEGPLDKFSKAYNPSSYYKALFVDRRLDYEFTILAPYIKYDENKDNTELYSENSPYKDYEKVWRTGRIYGTIYNGIEMGYDGDFSLIKAKLTPAPTPSVDEDYGEDVIYCKAEPDNTLEYTYEYDSAGVSYTDLDKSCRTIHNKATNGSVWTSGNTGYISTIDASNKQKIKQFYISTLNGEDIRHLYWSDFNKERLNMYVTGKDQIGNPLPSESCQVGGVGIDAFLNSENPYYVYQYHYTDIGGSSTDGKYNGDYNSYDLTKRYIDIGALPYENISEYNYKVQSCSYDMETVNNDGEIRVKARGGEAVKVNMDFSYPVSAMSATVTFSANGDGISPSDSPITDKLLTSGNWALRMILNEYNGSQREDGNAVVKIVKVFDAVNKNYVDYITAYKLASKDMSLFPYDNPIDVLENKIHIKGIGPFEFEQNEDDDSEYPENYYYVEGLNVTGNNTTKFAVIVERGLKDKMETYLKRGVRLYQIGPIIDCSPIKVDNFSATKNDEIIQVKITLFNLKDKCDFLFGGVNSDTEIQLSFNFSIILSGYCPGSLDRVTMHNDPYEEVTIFCDDKNKVVDFKEFEFNIRIKDTCIINPSINIKFKSLTINRKYKHYM